MNAGKMVHMLSSGIGGRVFVVCLIWGAATRLAPGEDASEPRPKSPAESIAAMQIVGDFRVELVAAEPLVKDPVAIDWGADGKLWVAEMADYPLGLDGRGKAGGRIRYLEDTNGDGRYDRSQVFLEGVAFPNGVMSWRRGVIVTAAPEVFYAEDTNGDGRADLRRTLYSGFTVGNPQLRVNGLRWGLDNWVYLANGISHRGSVKSHKTGQVVEIGARDLRIRPDQGLLEPASGRSQFGRNRDDWGNWFGVHNSYPLIHYVLADRYLRRNPHAAPADPARQLVLPRNPPIFPISQQPKLYKHPHHGDRFTSCCSAIIYRDELLFPRGARQHAFTCEPVHNMVHQEWVEPAGVTFTARRPDRQSRREFMASTDAWFRPVMARTGPDGALWIVDMYRHVIEHPQWIPDDIERKLSLRAGADRGRIYRIVPKSRPLRPLPRLDRFTNRQLVDALGDPSGVVRDKAHQLLLWRRAKDLAPQLARCVSESKNPRQRLHALCVLDGLGHLSAATLHQALRDEHPALRRHAIRLAESYAGGDRQAVRSAALALIRDPEPKVRLQLACTLGAWAGEEPARALGEMAAQCGEDSHMQAAVLSSVTAANIDSVFTALIEHLEQRGDPAAPPPPTFESLLKLTAPLKSPVALARGLSFAVPAEQKKQPVDPWRWKAVAAAIEVARKSGDSRFQPDNLDSELKKRLTAMIRRAEHVVYDGAAPAQQRAAAVALIGGTGKERGAAFDRLGQLLTPQSPPVLQAAIVKRLARGDDPLAAQRLLRPWRGYTPAIRVQVLATLLSRTAWTGQLLQAVESGPVARLDLDAATRQRLLTHRSAAIKKKAQRLFHTASTESRQQVLTRYRPALRREGNIDRGRAVFRKTCAKCHRIEDHGIELGPNLAAIQNRTPSGLLTSILDPNAAVDGRYLGYQVVTEEGATLAGMLVAETGAGITLADQLGKPHEIPRAEIDTLTSTGKSFMPEGLEAEISPQQMADLIAYLLAAGGPKQ